MTCTKVLRCLLQRIISHHVCAEKLDFLPTPKHNMQLWICLKCNKNITLSVSTRMLYVKNFIKAFNINMDKNPFKCKYTLRLINSNVAPEHALSEVLSLLSGPFLCGIYFIMMKLNDDGTSSLAFKARFAFCFSCEFLM